MGESIIENMGAPFTYGKFQLICACIGYGGNVEIWWDILRAKHIYCVNLGMGTLVRLAFFPPYAVAQPNHLFRLCTVPKIGHALGLSFRNGSKRQGITHAMWRIHFGVLQ